MEGWGGLPILPLGRLRRNPLTLPCPHSPWTILEVKGRGGEGVGEVSSDQTSLGDALSCSLGKL